MLSTSNGRGRLTRLASVNEIRPRQVSAGSTAGAVIGDLNTPSRSAGKPPAPGHAVVGPDLVIGSRVEKEINLHQVGFSGMLRRTKGGGTTD